MGEATAKMNIADLKKILNLPESPDSSDQTISKSSSTETDFSAHQRIHRVRRESMEQLNLIKVVGVYVCFVFFITSEWHYLRNSISPELVVLEKCGLYIVNKICRYVNTCDACQFSVTVCLCSTGLLTR